jgi:hypothetical protein
VAEQRRVEDGVELAAVVKLMFAPTTRTSVSAPTTGSPGTRAFRFDVSLLLGPIEDA